jgi:O-antigen/teichoic acid export membrane protein
MLDDSELLTTVEASARTGVHVIGLRTVIYALGFLGSVLTARALGADGRGRYVLPLTVLMILFTLANLGLEHAQIYLAGRGAPLTALWANGTLVGLLAAVVVWGLCAIVLLTPSSSIHADTPTSWLVVTIAQLPLMLHILYWLNVLQLAGRVRAGVAASAVGAVFQAVAITAMFLANGLTPFRVLVLITLTNLVVWGVVLGIGVRAGVASVHVDRAWLRAGLGFGVRAQMGLMFVFLLLRLDQVMVQRILGFASLGQYSLAVTLAELLWLLSDPFAAALLPHQVKAEGDDDVRLGYATARIALLLVSGAAIVCWIAAPWAIRIAFGSGFEAAVWPFRLLLPGVAALAIQRPLAGVLLKRGRPALVSVFGAGALVINVVWNLTLLHTLGIAAASIGSSLAYASLAAAYVVATRHAASRARASLVPRPADLFVLGRAFRSAASRSAA